MDLRSRFFAADGTMAIYAFPKKSVYDTKNLDELIDEVYKVSPAATGFPTTHKVFSRMVVSSFFRGTQLAVIVALVWILIIVRSWRGFLIAVLPLMIGGGWMVGLMAFFGIKYNYANIIALPLAMGLGVDYGVWFAHRRFELIDLSPWQVAANIRQADIAGGRDHLRRFGSHHSGGISRGIVHGDRYYHRAGLLSVGRAVDGPGHHPISLSEEIMIRKKKSLLTLGILIGFLFLGLGGPYAYSGLLSRRPGQRTGSP